jgi:hypothetical protein
MPTPIPDTASMDSEETYNLLMQEIEPELTMDFLPHLEEIYSSETESEREARWKWYAIAFELFDEQYHTFVQGMKNYFSGIRNTALATVRQNSEKEDRTILPHISDAIDRS